MNMAAQQQQRERTGRKEGKRPLRRTMTDGDKTDSSSALLGGSSRPPSWAFAFRGKQQTIQSGIVQYLFLTLQQREELRRSK